VDSNIADLSYYETALDEAASLGHVEIAQLLLLKGANIKGGRALRDHIPIYH